MTVIKFEKVFACFSPMLPLEMKKKNLSEESDL